MGQDISKEQARLDQLHPVMRQMSELTDKLGESAGAEAAAGTPATPGSFQELYRGAHNTLMQMYDEHHRLCGCILARSNGHSLPMPRPTPPFRMPKQAAVALEAGTPIPAASLRRGQRGGGSSSSKAGAHAGGAEGSITEPLLAAEPER